MSTTPGLSYDQGKEDMPWKKSFQIKEKVDTGWWDSRALVYGHSSEGPLVSPHTRACS